jgi:hypothetical protein
MIRVERGGVPSGTFAVVLAAMPHVLVQASSSAPLW